MSRDATHSGTDPSRAYFILQLKCECDSDGAKVSFPARTISCAKIESDATLTSYIYIYIYIYINNLYIYIKYI